MGLQDTRAGVTQAKVNNDASSLVFLEILALAIAIGIGTSSWRRGGGILLGGLPALSIPVPNIIFYLTMTATWPLVSYHIGSAVGQIGANYAIAAIAGLTSFGAHLAAIEWLEDMGRS